MTSTPITSPAVELEEHEHVWHVFSFEFPFTIGYRCSVCHEERFERPEPREERKR